MTDDTIKLKDNDTPPSDPTPTPPPVKEDNEWTEDRFKKILTEKRNAMTRIQQQEDELKALKLEKMEREDNYKAIAEQSQKELAEVKAKYEQKTTLINNSLKTAALKKELTKLGCKQEYIDKACKFGNIDDISYDEETGVFTGHSDMAKSIYDELKPLFGEQSPGVNQGVPVGSPGKLTLEEWRKLPLEERKQRRNELYTNLGI